MANEINYTDTTGQTLTFDLAQGNTIVESGGTLTERGSTGHYYGSVATPLAAGTYSVHVKSGSTILGSGILNWDGTKEVLENLDVAVSTRSTFNASSDQVLADVREVNDVAVTSVDDFKADVSNLDVAVSTRSTFNASSDQVLADVREVNNVAVTSVDDFKQSTSAIATAVWGAVSRTLTDKTGFELSAQQESDLVVAIEGALINEGDGQALLQAIINKINNDLDVSGTELAAIASAVRTELTTELARIDTTISSRATQTSVNNLPANTADSVWDEAYADHKTAGTFGKLADILRKSNYVSEGSVTNGTTPTTTIFNTDLGHIDGAFDHLLLVFVSGVLEGEARPILSYIGGNITLQEPLTVAPSINDEFIITNAHIHSIPEIQSGLATQSSLDTKASQASVNQIPTNPLLDDDSRLDNLDATISSRSTFNHLTDGVIIGVDDAQNIADAVESTLLNALDGTDFVTAIKNEIASITWPANQMPITEIVNNVWNRLLTSIGTTGSIGKLIKDNLDVAISSRLASASYTAPDNATIGNIDTAISNLNDFDPVTESVIVRDFTTGAIDGDAVNASAVTKIQNGLAQESTLNTKASQTSVNDLDTKLDTKSSQADVTAIKATTDKLDGFIEDDGLGNDRLTAKALEQAPDSTTGEVSIHSALDSYANKDDYKADVSNLATQSSLDTKASQASVNQIPTNPLLDDDSRLDNLDATISSRSTFNHTTNEVQSNIKKVNDVAVTNIDDFKAGSVDVDTDALATALIPELERAGGPLDKADKAARLAAKNTAK